jgi:hypothetical protein
MASSFFSRGRAFAVLFFFLFLSPLTAQSDQDTLGSLIPGSQIALFDGSTIDVKDLRVGAKIWTWLPSEKPSEGTVTSIRRVHSDTFLLLKAGGHQLQATGSHRVAVSNTRLVRLDTVKVGDKVTVWGTKGPQDEVVTSLRTFPVTLITYDLTIEGHRMFQVDSIVVGD